MILDDPGLWNRRDAPARTLVSTPPEHVQLIALCDDINQIPAVCTASISQQPDDLARLQSFARGDTANRNDGDEQVILPALTESDVAVRVARALAPLADLDLPEPSTAMSDGDDPPALAELVGAIDAEQVLAQWASDGSPTDLLDRPTGGGNRRRARHRRCDRRRRTVDG